MPAPRKSILRRLLEFRLLFVVNALLLVVLSLSFGREIIRNMEIRRDIADLESEAAALEARHLEITQLNTAFQTESYIEREARLKLGLKKPGEEVVVIQPTQVDEPAGEVAGAQDEPAVSGDLVAGPRVADEPVANPTKWWYYFFDTNRFTHLAS